MSEMNKITCGLCEDLAPLVEDGIAGEESREAVLKHLSECGICREKFSSLMGRETGKELSQIEGPDDEKIVCKVRERISVWALGGILLSLTAGSMISSTSSEPWVASLIFPLLCGIIHLTGVRIRKWTPLAAGGCWIFITLLTSGVGRLLDYPMALLTSLYPIALSYLGVLSAALLKYAFKGEF